MVKLTYLLPIPITLIPGSKYYLLSRDVKKNAKPEIKTGNWFASHKFLTVVIMIFLLSNIFKNGKNKPTPIPPSVKTSPTPVPTFEPTVTSIESKVSVTPTNKPTVKVISKTPTVKPTQVKQTDNQNIAPVSGETVSQKNAVKSAKSYLGYTAFSHDGLVAQLEYEKFSHADAVYGADNSGANWNEQAAKSAKQYMEYSAFSRGSLIDQLKYDKFTQEQAEYGATAVGL